MVRFVVVLTNHGMQLQVICSLQKKGTILFLVQLMVRVKKLSLNIRKA